MQGRPARRARPHETAGVNRRKLVAYDEFLTEWALLFRRPCTSVSARMSCGVSQRRSHRCSPPACETAHDGAGELMEADRTQLGLSSRPSTRRRLTREDVMTAAEVAVVLALPKSTVYGLARRGELPCARLGRTVRFLRDDVEARLRGA